MRIMKRVLCLVFVSIVLTACANKTETFRFNSNMDNVQVTVGEQSCYTPCELKLELRSGMYASVAHNEDDLVLDMGVSPFYKANTVREFEDTQKHHDFMMGYMLAEAPVFISSSTSSTTTEAGYVTTKPTVTSTGITENLMPTVWRYDTRAFYIYLKNPSNIFGGYALNDTKFTGYALMNFDAMRAELFNTDKPFIEAFTELSGMTNIEELLLESEDPLIFLDKLTLEKAKQIIYSDISDSAKISAISALLECEKAMLEGLVNMDSSAILVSNKTFLSKIESYLLRKRELRFRFISGAPLYKAAINGDAEAAYQLALAYTKGQGVKIDSNEAHRYYRMAAKLGHPLAQDVLAKIFARELTAAEAGNSNAMFHVGYYYANGEGVQQDYLAAIEWYTRATEKHPNAMFRIGQIYEKSLQDYAATVEWYERAAEKGNLDAKLRLGEMYEYGEGVQQDDAAAIKWYQSTNISRAIKDTQTIQAMYRIGRIYEKNENYKAAAHWYERAFDEGHYEAAFGLGVLYENGQGIEQNYAIAINLYIVAAKQGHPGAMLNLGRMYEHGEGGVMDIAEAIKWYTKATEYDDSREEAQKAIDRLK